MQRCLDLATLGMGYTAPNPMVGSVIFHNGKILAEEYHAMYGGLHAERKAIQSLDHIPDDAVLFVNLEPCNHHGKTPPCVDAIIKNGIRNVFIGQSDPNPIVSGNGIKMLQQTGVNITTGILEKECRVLNRRFNTFHEKNRPYIILKWAQSKNGKIGLPDARIQISNTHSIYYSHQWRSEEQSILIGSKTLSIDNPKLTVRFAKGKNPIPIVVAPSGSINLKSEVFKNEDCIVFIGKPSDKLNCKQITINPTIDIIPQIVESCKKLHIISVLIEGGAYTLQKFINAGIWDEARVFESYTTLEQGINAPYIGVSPISIIDLDDNKLLYFRN